mgnify:CR=1 FL=1
MFNMYKSPKEALEAAYPDYPWRDAFVKVSRPKRSFWHQRGKVAQFLIQAEEKLGIQQVCPVSI